MDSVPLACKDSLFFVLNSHAFDYTNFTVSLMSDFRLLNVLASDIGKLLKN